MNTPGSERKEISQLLAGDALKLFIHLEICSVVPNEIFDINVFTFDRFVQIHLLLRIFALNAIDYAIRPKDPNIFMCGVQLKFSTDDPRLNDPRLQFIPGGDGKCFNPPRRYQLLELDQSWIIAQRFEAEELHRISRSINPQFTGGPEAAIKVCRP